MENCITKCISCGSALEKPFSVHVSMHKYQLWKGCTGCDASYLVEEYDSRTLWGSNLLFLFPCINKIREKVHTRVRNYGKIPRLRIIALECDSYKIDHDFSQMESRILKHMIDYETLTEGLFDSIRLEKIRKKLQRDSDMLLYSMLYGKSFEKSMVNNPFNSYITKEEADAVCTKVADGASFSREQIDKALALLGSHPKPKPYFNFDSLPNWYMPHTGAQMDFMLNDVCKEHQPAEVRLSWIKRRKMEAEKSHRFSVIDALIHSYDKGASAGDALRKSLSKHKGDEKVENKNKWIFPGQEKGSKYSFKTSAEELVDLSEIAKDLSRENPCIHVRTHGTKTPQINVLLVHKSIYMKWRLLREHDDTVEEDAGFTDGIMPFENTHIIQITDTMNLSSAIKFVKQIKAAQLPSVINKKINKAPIEIKVTTIDIG